MLQGNSGASPAAGWCVWLCRWSEIPRYIFKVPSGWDEIPVSIADLGGTEVSQASNSKVVGHEGTHAGCF
jgi:hypothetical protein